MSTIIILILFMLSLCLSAMVAAYGTLSTSHLRHWAKKKDAAASKLYPFKARGSASFLTLELLRALCLSAAIVLLGTVVNSWVAWAVTAVVFFVAFVVLTELYLKSFGMLLLVWASRPLLAVTNALKPVTWPLGRMLDSFLDQEPTTLTREELKKMLTSVSPDDTDITADELRILNKAITFGEKSVHDVMTPKSKIVSVKESESLSPVVLDDLYKSGHERFPVIAEDGKTVVGMLNMHELMDVKRERSVSGVMQDKVYYVDEDRDLTHVLETFYKTKQTVFIVHNQASDMVGIISIEDVVQEILGKPGKAAETEVAVNASEEPLAVVE